MKTKTIDKEPIEEFEIINRNTLETIVINIDWETETLSFYDSTNQLQEYSLHSDILPKWFTDFVGTYTDFLSLFAYMSLFESFNPTVYDVVNIKRIY